MIEFTYQEMFPLGDDTTDDSMQDHMIPGADGLWILIGCYDKGHKVFS